MAFTNLSTEAPLLLKRGFICCERYILLGIIGNGYEETGRIQMSLKYNKKY